MSTPTNKYNIIILFTNCVKSIQTTLLKTKKRSQVALHPKSPSVDRQSAGRTILLDHFLLTSPTNVMSVVTLGNLGVK